MKHIFLLIFLSALVACKPAPDTAAEASEAVDSTGQSTVSIPGLTRLWETPKTLTTAESVLFDSDNNLLYVSCIGGVPPNAKDGDGFISRVRLDGQIADEKWVTGLDAPKGMGLVGNTLYVTDIDKLVAIDLTTGSITKTWPVSGAQFLNDVHTTPAGLVYFTDSNTSTLYRLENDNITSVLADPGLGGTNGVLVEGDMIFMASFEEGFVVRLDTRTNEVQKIAEGVPGGDGIERYGDGLLVSNWNGEVYYVTMDGQVTEVLDTREAKYNAADIEVIPGKNLLLVPTFFGNTVAAYELKMP